MIARWKARWAFDLVAGFTYSQTLLACVESDLLALLSQGPVVLTEIAEHTGLSDAAALRLVRAAAAIELAQEVAPNQWMLGQQGAALHTNEGALAMVRHNRVLYRDLAEPLDLLRADRGKPTALSQFWHYAAEGDGEAASEYSQLMAQSQAMVCEQVLAAYDFSQHRSLLDVGGGHGRFAAGVVNAHPGLRIGILDLPPVLDGTSAWLGNQGLSERISLHPGDFFHSPLPSEYDCISLVRILHDHDDDEAVKLLTAIRKALPPGGRLLIAEPMADTRGAKGMGDAYFGLYLWAMNSGRPRSAEEIMAMLSAAGFSRSRQVKTHQPLVCSLIVSFL
ncbi:methyltransferase [Aurantiacibacter sediminis]|nr:methyltransferase [Aurantiacibacter sediminis]